MWEAVLVVKTTPDGIIGEWYVGRYIGKIVELYTDLENNYIVTDSQEAANSLAAHYNLAENN
jgi:hypothetical protein